jgi:hypothetical protein
LNHAADFSNETVADVAKEAIDDPHGLAEHASVGVNLLSHFLDDMALFPPALFPLL